MSSAGPLLPSILANTQTPHQPFLVLQDSATCSGVPVLSHLIGRNVESGTPVAIISVLNTPSSLGLDDHRDRTKIRTLDLTNLIPGFSFGSTSSSKNQSTTLNEIKDWLSSACKELGRGVQVYIDAADVLAEDYGCEREVLRLIKDTIKLVSSLKAPSRLTLLLPSSSSLLPHIITSTLSPTLTSLLIHPPAVIHALRETYLFPPPISGDLSEPGVTGGSRFRAILESATNRNESLRLGLVAEHGAVVGDWGLETSGSGPKDRGHSSHQAQSGGVVVEIVVRKATGGASKGMLRTLEALRPISNSSDKGKGREMERLESCRWDEVGGLDRLRTAGTAIVEDEGEKKEDEKKHPSVNSTFNLGLTDSQRASRAEVPIPYAHEGDDAPNAKRYDTTNTGAGIIFEPGSDDDVDDDDPDDDLDF